MPNDDLISRADVLELAQTYGYATYDMPYGSGDMIIRPEDVMALPVIDVAPERQGYVRVTRCRDCKRWEYDLDLATIGKGTCLNSLLWTEPNDYCSRGERADAPTCGPDYCEIGGGDDES